MQPPLPEVPKVLPPSNAKPAFFGLNVVVSVEVVSIFIYILLFVVFHKRDYNPLSPVWIYGVWIVIYSTIVSFLWRGYNWARWTMLVFSLLSLISFLSPEPSVSQYDEIQRIYSPISSIWAIIVGIWLLLPGVARHFKSPKPILETE